MFNENPKEEAVIAMRNREIRLNREGEYWTDEEKEQLRTMPFHNRLHFWQGRDRVARHKPRISC